MHLSRGTPTANRQILQRAQMDFFSAPTGIAFTTVSFPKAITLPALVAGFTRVLIMQSPGMVNLPAFFTSFVATVARVFKIFAASDFLSSCAVAMASARPVLVIRGLLDFIAFAFMGAMVMKVCLQDLNREAGAAE